MNRRYLLVLLLGLALFFTPVEFAKLSPSGPDSQAAALDICESNCEGGCQYCKNAVPLILQILTGNYSRHCALADTNAGNCDCCTSVIEIGRTACFATGQQCFGVVVSIEPSPR